MLSLLHSNNQLFKKYTSIAALLFFSINNAALAVPAMSPQAPSVNTIGSISQIIDFPEQLDIPLQNVQLKEYFKGDNGRLVIHIQDAHSNLSGQQNLAKTLEYIMQHYDIPLVLLEGGEGDVTLDEVRDATPLKEWQKIAKQLLYDGIVSGEEFLNLTTTTPMQIMGIENPDLYNENLLSYRDIIGVRSEALAYLRQAQIAVNRLKSKMYPASLLNYDTRINAVNGNTFMQNNRLLLELAGYAELNIEGQYPEIAKYKALELNQSQLDLNAVREEQMNLFKALSQTNEARAAKTLFKSISDLSDTPIMQNVVMQRLFAMAERQGLGLKEGSPFWLYRANLEAFAQLKMDALLDEFGSLEKELYQTLLEGKDSKTLRALDRHLTLLTKAYQSQMSAHEYKELRVSQRYFQTLSWQAYLNRVLAEYDFHANWIVYDDILDDTEAMLHEFYSLVSERDSAFIENSKAIMESQKQKAAFLISGGYHTQNLTQLWREEGTSYIVLTPTVTSETDHNQYESILLNGVDDEFVESELEFQDSQIDLAQSNSTKVHKRPFATNGFDLLTAQTVQRPVYAGVSHRSLELLQSLGIPRVSRMAQIRSGDKKLTKVGKFNITSRTELSEGLEIAVINGNHYKELRAKFRDEVVNKGEKFLILIKEVKNKSGNLVKRPIALIRDMPERQTLHTMPFSARSKSEVAKESYYESILEYLHIRVQKNGYLTEWVDASGQNARYFLNGHGDDYKKDPNNPFVNQQPFKKKFLSGTRFLRGKNKALFQMRYHITKAGFDKSKDTAIVETTYEIRNGVGRTSYLVLPRKVALHAGVGVINRQVASALRKLGIEIHGSNRSPQKALNIAKDGATIHLLDADHALSFSKVKNLHPVGTLEEFLDSDNPPDLIVEGFDTKFNFPKFGLVKVSYWFKQVFGLKALKRGIHIIYQGGSGISTPEAPVPFFHAFFLSLLKLSPEKTGVKRAVGGSEATCFSCNGTTTTSGIGALAEFKDIESVQASFKYIRREVDFPEEPSENAIVEEFKSHHAGGDLLDYFTDLKAQLPDADKGKVDFKFKEENDLTTWQRTDRTNLYHQVAAVIRAKKKDGTYLKAADFRKALQKAANIAIVNIDGFVNTEMIDGQLEAVSLDKTRIKGLVGHIFDDLGFQTPNISPVAVEDLYGENNVHQGITFGALTFQKYNVIPNNVALALTLLDLVPDGEVGAKEAIRRAATVTEMDILKEELETETFSHPDIIKVYEEAARLAGTEALVTSPDDLALSYRRLNLSELIPDATHYIGTEGKRAAENGVRGDVAVAIAAEADTDGRGDYVYVDVTPNTVSDPTETITFSDLTFVTGESIADIVPNTVLRVLDALNDQTSRVERHLAALESKSTEPVVLTLAVNPTNDAKYSLRGVPLGPEAITEFLRSEIQILLKIARGDSRVHFLIDQEHSNAGMVAELLSLAPEGFLLTEIPEKLVKARRGYLSDELSSILDGQINTYQGRFSANALPNLRAGALLAIEIARLDLSQPIPQGILDAWAILAQVSQISQEDALNIILGVASEATIKKYAFKASKLNLNVGALIQALRVSAKMSSIAA